MYGVEDLVQKLLLERYEWIEFNGRITNHYGMSCHVRVVIFVCSSMRRP
jgi:hypothetical protein